MVIFVHQFRQAPKPKVGIEFIKCHFQNGDRNRIIWIAPWEVIVGYELDIIEGDKSERWTLTKILVPDQEI